MADQDEYLRVAVEAVRAAARVVEQWVGRIEVRHKGPADLVTQADLASQQTVRHIVLGAFPEHRLLGEEQCPEDSRELTAPGAPRKQSTDSRELTAPGAPRKQSTDSRELTAPGDVSGENPDGSRPQRESAGGSSIRWTAPRITFMACRTIAFRWPWSAAASC